MLNRSIDINFKLAVGKNVLNGLLERIYNTPKTTTNYKFIALKNYKMPDVLFDLCSGVKSWKSKF